jgi:hypothetical protein
MFRDTSMLPSGFTGEYGSDLRPNTEGLSIGDGSPATDSGAALVGPYDGSANSVLRPSGGGWDRGAYELSMGAKAPGAPSNLRISGGR